MANDARIAIKNRKKNTLNDLLENLTKPKVRDLGYLKEVLTTRALQFGQKNFRFDSIRFANLINLPLLH